MANSPQSGPETPGSAEKGVTYAVGKVIDYFGEDLAGDNKMFKKAMSTPENKAIIKKLAAQAIVDFLAEGAPVDDEGKPIYKTKAAKIEASLGSIVGEMATRAITPGQIASDIVNFGDNVKELKREVNKQIEGIIYDTKAPMRKAEELLAAAGDLLSWGS